MQVTVRGWARDMGRKPILECEMLQEDIVEEIDRLERGKTYFEVRQEVTHKSRGRRKVSYTAKVSAHAELNLNGSYLVQLELSRDEIARLFYLTNGDRGLPDILNFFSDLKQQEAHGPRDV